MKIVCTYISYISLLPNRNHVILTASPSLMYWSDSLSPETWNGCWPCFLDSSTMEVSSKQKSSCGRNQCGRWIRFCISSPVLRTELDRPEWVVLGRGTDAPPQWLEMALFLFGTPGVRGASITAHKVPNSRLNNSTHLSKCWVTLARMSSLPGTRLPMGLTKGLSHTSPLRTVGKSWLGQELLKCGSHSPNTSGFLQSL